MGQKVNPIGFRIGVNKTWDSIWYASAANYSDLLLEDIKIKKHIKSSLNNAGISKVVIERKTKKINIIIHASKPGIVIGKKGSDLDKIKQELSKFVKDDISINIVEVKKPEIDAVLIAESVCQQLEKRISFRKVMKRAIQNAMRMGAQGIRINCSGRLGGAEIARTEWYREGRVPLHTLRADIDYANAIAQTTYGVLGVKVWVYKGETVDKKISDN